MSVASSLRRIVIIILSLSLLSLTLYGCGTATKSNPQNSSTHSISTKSSKTATSSTSSSPQIPAGAIRWEEASEHVGETITVYGPVKGTKYASSSNGSPTFIDIGASYPKKNRVTITIWGKNRSAFSSSPEDMYRGKTLCVTGEVYLYQDVCNIEVSSPSQIKVL